jgi:hypothetical protein
LPLPNHVARVPAIVAPPVGTLYPVGLPVGQVFVPVDSHALYRMTLQQISELAEWANEDFGIVVGDDVTTRRVKLFQHYSIQRKFSILLA